jgi:glycosyltransferase involved in cell wall biosynthesis
MCVDFSVVIPTFRRPRELAQAISSVVSQSGVSVEIIVVDDSPEGSAEQTVASFREPRALYLRNQQPTKGMPSVVRNLGWPRAAGSFVHFLDDDDIVPDGHYLRAKEIFSTHPEVGLIFGQIEPFGSGPAEQIEREKRYFSRAARKAVVCQRFGPRWAFAARMLFADALLVCSASILRRKCVEQLGGFDPEIRLMEDADFHVRVMRECGAHFMERVAVRYRINSPSLMHSPHPEPLQLQRERFGRRRMQSKYREKYGALEFYALAFFSRTFLAIL